jgi:hypothetical protein
MIISLFKAENIIYILGAKLIALKEKLKEKMKVKREEHRKQKQEIFDMDNEEGYVEDEEDKVLE